jgi:hypothetical protein
MKLGRLTLAALALSGALMATPKAEAANGSNYLHAINGVDVFFGYSVFNPGSFSGIWRCYPSEILHAPTLYLGGGALNGTYSTKFTAWQLVAQASTGSTFDFPTIFLSSSLGKCLFVTSGGFLDYTTLSITGFGSVVVGPSFDNAGPVTVNLLAGVANLSILNPFPVSYAVEIKILTAAAFGVSSVPVPENEALVVFAQNDPVYNAPLGAQYWTASTDERNICSSWSYLRSSSGVTWSFVTRFEWGIGIGTLDATLHTANNELQTTNAHSAAAGFTPGFDPGTGGRTLSLTGVGPFFTAPPGTDALYFQTYDENGNVGAGHFPFGNGWGADGTATALCSNRQPNWFDLGAPFPMGGGPGGPATLYPFIPTVPRSVGRIDALAKALFNNNGWRNASIHTSTRGGCNIPWFAGAPTVGNSGSTGTGTNGGFGFPLAFVPPIGISAQVLWWSWPTDPTISFLDFFSPKAVHSLSNGYDTKFWP